MTHGHICASTFSSPRLLVRYTFLLSGRPRSPTRNNSFSVCAKSIGLCTLVFVPISSLNLLYTSLCAHHISPHFLALDVSFFLSIISLLSCTPPNIISTTILLGSSYGFSCVLRLRYPILFILPRPFVTLSHTALSTMAANIFVDMFLTLYRRFQYVKSLCVQVDTFPALLLLLYSSYLSILGLF